MNTVLVVQSSGAGLGPGITALVGRKTAPVLQELDAVSRVCPDLLVAVHLAGHHPHVQVMLGTPVAVGARAELRQAHLLSARVAARLLDREQSTRLLSLALELRLGGAGEAELVAHAAVGVVGVPLDEIGHRVLGAPAVHHLGARVVRVHDVGPSNVTEISTLLQFFNWLANLILLVPVMDRVTVVGVAGGGALDVPRAPALLLHPGRAVCVHLPADRHGGAHGQVRVRIPSLIEDLHVGSFSAVFGMHLGVNTVWVLTGVSVLVPGVGLVRHLLGDTHAAVDEEGEQHPEHPDPCHPDLCH